MPNHYDGPEYRTVYEIRGSTDDPDMTTITFARFGVFNEIHDPYEGRFVEMPMPGAYQESFDRRGESIKVLFNHGRDTALGQRSLGVPTNLRETDIGPTADVRWIDRPYVDDIRAGIPPAVEVSVYGASYMFRAQDDWVDHPGKSEGNPLGLPERRLLTVDTVELGPVTFAADENTRELVGAVRSLTGRFAPTPIDREDGKSGHPHGADTATKNKRAQTATAFRIAQRNNTLNRKMKL